MSKFYFFLCLISLCFTMDATAQWTEVAPLNFPGRHHPVTFSINGYGYVMTGTASNGSILKDVQRYDPEENRWEQMSDFPGSARSFSYAVVEGGKAYIAFGLSPGGSTLNDLWSYDPDTDAWTRLANCTCSGRVHPAFLALNGKLYVGAGSASSNLKDFWEYDIDTDTWTRLLDFPSTARHHPYHFAINDKVYIGLGHGSQTINGEIIYRDFYGYDPIEGEWERIADIPGQGRVAGTQFSHNDKGYVLSGDGEDHWTIATGEFWQYDPQVDLWEELPPHPGNSLWAPGSFVIDDNVYFLGGYHNNFASFPTDVWTYNMGEPSTSTTDVEAPSTIDVFPNPAIDAITLQMNGNIIARSDLKIMDINGNIIHKIENYNEHSIDVSHMVPGIYFITLATEDKRFMGKFIKL